MMELVLYRLMNCWDQNQAVEHRTVLGVLVVRVVQVVLGFD